MPRSTFGGRHELGQNFLTHKPTINKITALTAATRGPILELGAGDGALTKPLARLGRPLTAPVIGGNIPFHLTTPILRRLLRNDRWTDAVLLTQWEVARKRCGVGGSTLMTAQSAPRFTFTLHGRVPAWGFTPRPSVDGGIMRIQRRSEALVPVHERAAYERFVRAVFIGSGRQSPSHHRAPHPRDARAGEGIAGSLRCGSSRVATGSYSATVGDGMELVVLRTSVMVAECA